MNAKKKTERAPIAKRLKEARKAAGYRTATDAASAFGWNYAAYSKHENAQRGILPSEGLKYAAAFGVTLDYLYYGKIENSGDRPSAGDIMPLKVKALSPVSLMSIEFFEELAAGEHAVCARNPRELHAPYTPEPGFFVEAHDQSMSKSGERRSIEPGAKVAVEIGEKPTPSNIVLVLVRAEKAAMLRIYHEISRLPDGFVIYDLVPLNPAFRTIRISSANEAVILGVCKKVYQVQDLT